MLADHSLFQNRFFQALLCIGILGAVGVIGLRTYRGWSPPATEFNWEQRGHSDFHYGTYVPTEILLNGDSPYTESGIEGYPISKPAPPFSPAHFLAHAPLVLAGLKPANVIFFGFNTLLLVALGWMSCRLISDKTTWGVVLTVILLVLISRPGHQTLFTGYFTAELAIGTTLALHFARTRPWLAGLGIFLTSFKPTFLVPLAILMLCRRDFRAVILGGLFSTAGVLIGLGWLAWFSNPIEVVQGILDSQRSHEANPGINPANSWVRTDLLALLSKSSGTSPSALTYLVTMVPILALPGWLLWNIGKKGYRHGASDASGLLIGLTILVAFYHSIYDCLILIPAWVGLTFYGSKVFGSWSHWQRCVVMVLTSVPAASYFASISSKNALQLTDNSRLWHVLTAVSSLALLTALMVTVGVLIGQRFQRSNTENRET